MALCWIVVKGRDFEEAFMPVVGVFVGGGGGGGGGGGSSFCFVEVCPWLMSRLKLNKHDLRWALPRWFVGFWEEYVFGQPFGKTKLDLKLLVWGFVVVVFFVLFLILFFLNPFDLQRSILHSLVWLKVFKHEITACGVTFLQMRRPILYRKEQQQQIHQAVAMVKSVRIL